MVRCIFSRRLILKYVLHPKAPKEDNYVFLCTRCVRLFGLLTSTFAMFDDVLCVKETYREMFTSYISMGLSLIHI